jgi:hypothetical protein
MSAELDRSRDSVPTDQAGDGDRDVPFGQRLEQGLRLIPTPSRVLLQDHTADFHFGEGSLGSV